MKRLVIIRHGKAEKLTGNLKDRDRCLAERGKSDVPFMAHIIKQKGIAPGLIISSPANRAFQTAQIFAAIFEYPESDIVTREFIYHYYDWLSIYGLIEELDPAVENVFLFGHNPTLEELAGDLCPPFREFLPTSGVAGIEFSKNNWDKVKPGKGKLIFFEYPKKYPERNG